VTRQVYQSLHPWGELRQKYCYRGRGGKWG
jgi:hypothetical protein